MTDTPPLDLDEVRRTELYLCSDRKGVGCTRKIKLIESLTEEVERLRGRYQTGGRSEIDYCDEIVRLTRDLEAERETTRGLREAPLEALREIRDRIAGNRGGIEEIDDIARAALPAK